MKKIAAIFLLILFFGCNEVLIEKPENLIPKDKMVLILKDMAVINAAKNSNVRIFLKNKIDPTKLIFKKYDIDSLQFVQSDKYYVSKPVLYQEIYQEIDTLLEIQNKEVTALKKISDSIVKAEKKAKNIEKNRVKDSLSKI